MRTSAHFVHSGQLRQVSGLGPSPRHLSSAMQVTLWGEKSRSVHLQMAAVFSSKNIAWADNGNGQ